MKILADRNIRNLIRWELVIILIFLLIAAAFSTSGMKDAALSVLLCFLCMSVALLMIHVQYFKNQHLLMEEAITQIRQYISGDLNSRLDDDAEGELFRLFHEVNSLISIVTAHIESDGKEKQFLKTTITDISHQLKTPLAALSIYNGILQEESQQIPTIKEFADLSEQEIDRIEILVLNLLKITKLDACAIQLDIQKEYVLELISSLESQFSFRAGQEDKVIRFSGDPEISLFCDGSWLMEALGNIIKNALDHTQKGDMIDIQWKQLTSVVQIMIKDTGSGIHQEDLYHIFKRFYRSRFSQDTQGIGLGLPLAKAIIEAHGGTIEVESELGIGTAFTINMLIPTSL